MLKTSLEIVAPELAARPLMSEMCPSMTLEQEKELWVGGYNPVELDDPYGPMRKSVLVDLRLTGGYFEVELVSSFPGYPDWLYNEVEQCGWDFVKEYGLFQEHWLGGGMYEATLFMETGVLPGDVITFRVYEPIWTGGEEGDWDHKVDLVSIKPRLSREASRNWFALRLLERELEIHALKKREQSAHKRLMLRHREWWRIKYSIHGQGLGAKHAYAMIWAEPKLRNGRIWQAHGQLVRADVREKIRGEDMKVSVLRELMIQAEKKLKLTPAEFERLPVKYS